MRARRPPNPPSRSRLGDHPDYVEAIGMISIETVALELELAGLFARLLLLRLSTGRAIFLAPKNERTRLDILRDAANAELGPTPLQPPGSVLERQKAEALAKVKDIIARSQDAINHRHRVIHDEWDVSDDNKEITRRLVDGKVTRPSKRIPISELRGQIKTLRILIDDVYELAVKFRRHPPTMIDLKNSSTNSG
jgi:hypothetical protein